MKGAYIRIPIMLLAIFATFTYVDERTFLTTLIVWLGYALLCLGLLKSNRLTGITLTKRTRNV